MLRSIPLTLLFISGVFGCTEILANECTVKQLVIPDTSVSLEHVNDAPRTTDLRGQLIESWWLEHCDNMHRSNIPGKRSDNLICRVEGDQKETVVIGAHYDKVQPGWGVADNWSGVVVLDALARKFQNETPELTLEFVAFAAEEPGMFGSKAYLEQTERNIVGMINLDTLGLQATIIAGESDALLACKARAIAESLQFPFSQKSWSDITGDWEPFIKNNVPALSLHSVDRRTIKRIHNRRDRTGNVDIGYLENAYWLSLNLIYELAFVRD